VPEATSAIVIATLLNPEGQTGVQSHFNAFSRYLRAAGKSTVLVTPYDAPRALVYPTFAVRRLLDKVSGTASVWWYRHWHEFFLTWALKRTLARLPGSAVYAQCPLSARAALAVRQARQAVVLVVHFNRSQADEWSEKGRIRPDGFLARRIRAMEAKVLPKLDGIVYVSRFMKGELERRLEALQSVKNAVIPNFCSTPRSGKCEVAADIINVGTLEPRKNQAFLLQGLAHAHAAGHRYTLVLVGDGPDRSRLEQLAARLGIADAVRFAGAQPRAVDWMPSARLYAHAATVENLPVALIEAMASGVPIVAPAVGGIPDLIEDGRNGAFWNLTDPRAAGEILIRLLEDPPTLKALGEGARARFHAEFETAQVAARLERFILGCVRTPTEPPQ
jgi:glycosyltransferase involved in cell wall biosynthesis